MNTKFRPAFMALAVSAIAVVAITGATLRGKSKEGLSVADTCATAAWPLIPANCIPDASGRQVRMVGVEADTADATIGKVADGMQLRFARDFE